MTGASHDEERRLIDRCVELHGAVGLDAIVDLAVLTTERAPGSTTIERSIGAAAE